MIFRWWLPCAAADLVRQFFTGQFLAVPQPGATGQQRAGYVWRTRNIADFTLAAPGNRSRPVLPTLSIIFWPDWAKNGRWEKILPLGKQSSFDRNCHLWKFCFSMPSYEKVKGTKLLFIRPSTVLPEKIRPSSAAHLSCCFLFSPHCVLQPNFRQDGNTDPWTGADIECCAHRLRKGRLLVCGICRCLFINLISTFVPLYNSTSEDVKIIELV